MKMKISVTIIHADIEVQVNAQMSHTFPNPWQPIIEVVIISMNFSKEPTPLGKVIDREHVDGLSSLVNRTLGVLSNPIAGIALSPVTKANTSSNDTPTDSESSAQTTIIVSLIAVVYYYLKCTVIDNCTFTSLQKVIEIHHHPLLI
jgi:hypothetical protein